MARRRNGDDRGEVTLEDGTASHVGDGLFVITQVDDYVGLPVRVVISIEDIRRMLSMIVGPEPAGPGQRCVLATAAGS